MSRIQVAVYFPTFVSSWIGMSRIAVALSSFERLFLCPLLHIPLLDSLYTLVRGGRSERASNSFSVLHISGHWNCSSVTFEWPKVTSYYVSWMKTSSLLANSYLSWYWMERTKRSWVPRELLTVIWCPAYWTRVKLKRIAAKFHSTRYNLQFSIASFIFEILNEYHVDYSASKPTVPLIQSYQPEYRITFKDGNRTSWHQLSTGPTSRHYTWVMFGSLLSVDLILVSCKYNLTSRTTSHTINS